MNPRRYDSVADDRINYFPMEREGRDRFVIYDKENEESWIESDTSVEEYGIDER